MTQIKETASFSLFPFWGLVLATIILMATVIGAESIDDQNLFGMNLKDSMHTPVFFISTYLLFGIASKINRLSQLTTGTLSGLIFLICFAVAIAIEVAQPWFGRHASFLDVFYDLIGTCTAIILIASIQTRSLIVLALPGAIILLTLASVRPVYYAWVEKQSSFLFPVMIDFEQNWQKEFYRPSSGSFLTDSKAPKGWAQNQTNTLRWNYETSTYPSVHFKHFPGDWTSYEYLSLDVFSKNKAPVELSLRIHDNAHNNEMSDRFNSKITINEGLTNIVIDLNEVSSAPEGRTLDMKQIQEIILFTYNPREAGSLYLDNLRLN